MTSEETRDEFTALRAAYRRAMPRDAAELVAHRAMQGASSVGAQGRQNRRMLGAAAGLITLSAAAVALAVRGRPEPSPAMPAAAVAAVSDSTVSTLAVDVPAGQNAIVFTTRNPRIAVVWIY